MAVAVGATIPVARTSAQEASPAATPAPGGALSGDRVEAALGKLDALIADAMTRTGIPGAAVAVIHDGAVVYEKGFGVRDVGSSQEVTPETVFQVASMSKAISSTVVAAAVGEGTVSWDSVASELLPGFALSDPWVTAQVALRDLFSHRSGLPAYAGDALSATFGYGRDESVQRLRFVRQASPIRSSFAYTNLGLAVAGYATAAAAGTSWEELADDRLFRPLGMEHSSYRYADYASRANKAAPHYRRRDGRWALGEVTDADSTAPAGGVSSTLRDLTKWARLQLGGGVFEGAEVVASAALMETRRPQILAGSPANPAEGPALFYGLGWYLEYDDRGRLHMRHIGDFSSGFRSGVSLLPEAGLGMVVLTNAWPNALCDGLPKAFFEVVERGEPTKDWIGFFEDQTAAGIDALRKTLPFASDQPPSGDPALLLDAYIGTFTNELYGEITVRVAGDQLVLDLGPQPVSLDLTHWTRDVFTYPLPPSGEVMLGRVGVQFLIGPKGTATELVFGLPTVGPDSLATFTRV